MPRKGMNPGGRAAARIPLAVPADLLEKIDADVKRLKVTRNEVMRAILEAHYTRSQEARAADVLDYAARQGVSERELVAFMNARTFSGIPTR